jgi:hypothetical protein
VEAAGRAQPALTGAAMSTLRSLPRDASFEQQLQAYRQDHARRRLGDLGHPCPDRLWRQIERAKRAADLQLDDETKRRCL